MSGRGDMNTLPIRHLLFMTSSCLHRFCRSNMKVPPWKRKERAPRRSDLNRMNCHISPAQSLSRTGTPSGDGPRLNHRQISSSPRPLACSTLSSTHAQHMIRAWIEIRYRAATQMWMWIPFLVYSSRFGLFSCIAASRNGRSPTPRTFAIMPSRSAG